MAKSSTKCLHLSANKVKTKFVPAMIKPTAVGLSNPIDLNRVAELRNW
jgi:hypothetical protein